MTALEAARLMNERGIGCVVVLEGRTVVGIFTERDVMRRVVAAERDPAIVTLREVMTTSLVSAAEETSLEECAALMTARRVRHLPVMSQGSLAGLITIGDILAWQVGDQAVTIAQLNSYLYDTR
jgi:CBS domain-containing protein